MDFVTEDFRNARAVLRGRNAWESLRAVLCGLSREDVIEVQEGLVRAVAAGLRRSVPRGGQTAVNRLINDHLGPEWRREPRLFHEAGLHKWKMDFLADRVGVEVSFNHAEAIPWQFTRLNIAGESERVIEDSKIDVGVVITATQSLKAWSKMDSAVGTFDAFQAWLREMKPILPIPILLIGLQADGWAATDVFGGTRPGLRAGADVALTGADDPRGDVLVQDEEAEPTED